MDYGLASVRRLISGFLSWWFGELKALLPAWLTRLLSPPVKELVVELIGRRLVLQHRNGATERELGIIELDDSDLGAAKAALRPLIADLNLDRLLVLLRLPAELALRKIVDLPAAVEENLLQVMAFEMDRLTPFPAVAVHYDAQVIDRDSDDRRIRVELMVLPRAAVDSRLQMLHQLGLDFDALALPRGTNVPAQALWRLPLAASDSAGQHLIDWLSIALFALAGVLLITTVYLTFDKQRARVELLENKVATVKKEVEEAQRLQEQIKQLSAQRSFIVDKKRARPPVVQILDELTRALPDDTWLYRLRLVNGELQTFGYSPNASAIIGHIENSALFKNAQFRAPLTRDQRINAEQFQIAFQVDPDKAQ